MRSVWPPHCRLMLLLPFYYHRRGDRFSSGNWVVVVVIFFELSFSQLNIASSRPADEGTGPMPIRLWVPLSSAFRPSSDTNSGRRSVPTAMRRPTAAARCGCCCRYRYRCCCCCCCCAAAAAATRLPCRR
jgi:hypothetical protein